MFSRIRRWLFSDNGHETSDEALIRTHLANERTFLAWLRSSVVLLGVALGAIAFATENGPARFLALTLGGFTAFAGVLMVAWAYVSFEVTLSDIERRSYRPPRRLVLAASALLIVTGVIILGVLAVEVFD